MSIKVQQLKTFRFFLLTVDITSSLLIEFQLYSDVS